MRVMCAPPSKVRCCCYPCVSLSFVATVRVCRVERGAVVCYNCSSSRLCVCRVVDDVLSVVLPCVCLSFVALFGAVLSVVLPCVCILHHCCVPLSVVLSVVLPCVSLLSFVCVPCCGGCAERGAAVCLSLLRRHCSLC